MVIAVVAFFILSACKKESNDEHVLLTINENDKFVLVAGDMIDDSLVYKEFEPTKKVKGKRIGTENDFEFRDTFSLDVDLDENPDIRFRYYMQFYQPSCDCLAESTIPEGANDCCMPMGLIYCCIKAPSPFEIAVTEDLFDGLPEDYVPAKLNSGDTIDNRLTWKSYGDKDVVFAMRPYISEWSEEFTFGYIGFRVVEVTDTLYGWIKVNTNSCGNIELYSHAIERSKRE